MTSTRLSAKARQTQLRIKEVLEAVNFQTGMKLYKYVSPDMVISAECTGELSNGRTRGVIRIEVALIGNQDFETVPLILHTEDGSLAGQNRYLFYSTGQPFTYWATFHQLETAKIYKVEVVVPSEPEYDFDTDFPSAFRALVEQAKQNGIEMHHIRPVVEDILYPNEEEQPSNQIEALRNQVHELKENMEVAKRDVLKAVAALA